MDLREKGSPGPLVTEAPPHISHWRTFGSTGAVGGCPASSRAGALI